MAEQLLEIYRPWFADGFDQASGKEDIVWELVFGISSKQTPQGVEQTPMLLIYAHVKAATIGDFHTLIGHLPALGLTRAGIEQETHNVVEALLTMRSQALYQTNGHGGAPTSMPWTPPKG